MLLFLKCIIIFYFILFLTQVSFPAFTSFVPHRYCLNWVTANLSKGCCPFGLYDESHFCAPKCESIETLLFSQSAVWSNCGSCSDWKTCIGISEFRAKGERWHECWAHEGALIATNSGYTNWKLVKHWTKDPGLPWLIMLNKNKPKTCCNVMEVLWSMWRNLYDFCFNRYILWNILCFSSDSFPVTLHGFLVSAIGFTMLDHSDESCAKKDNKNLLKMPLQCLQCRYQTHIICDWHTCIAHMHNPKSLQMIKEYK